MKTIALFFDVSFMGKNDRFDFCYFVWDNYFNNEN